MRNPVRILYLENSANDVENVRGILASGDIATVIKRVETRDDFLTGLAEEGLDLIFSDEASTSLCGLSALTMARSHRPEVPFIFIARKTNEETVVRSLERGASDYVCKQYLSKLLPVVYRTLRFLETQRALARVEEHLKQARKMELIGQMAGSVAHDFNNLLTVILGHASVLIPDADGPARAGLEEILKAAEGGAHIIGQMMAFSRRREQCLQVVDLSALVQSSERMSRMLVGDRVKLVVRPGAGPAWVKADSVQIQQVILNLVSNARDAMPDGGVVTVEVSRLDSAEPVAGGSGSRGSYVVLSVSDTGHGMDKQTQERIFEPFFTTKKPGRGTGLGLTIVHEIVKQHRGLLRVSSEADQGTRFNIYLVHEEEVPRSRAERQLREGGLTVLEDGCVSGALGILAPRTYRPARHYRSFAARG